VKNPRIVTHLFADGGRIIRTTRTEYAEHVTRPDMQPFVRGLMKEQHKSMFTALRLGQLDTLLEDVCGPFDQPLQLSKAPPAPELVSAPPPSPAVTERAPPAPPELPTLVTALADADRASEPAERQNGLSNPNLRKATPTLPPLGAVHLDLDVTSLDRLPAQFPVERNLAAPTARPFLDSNLPRRARPNPPAAASTPPGLSRPAARFAGAPSKTSSSIFGEGALSEQSLDEVILSYLAEDLDSSE
jgi:hypothetical protein